MVFLFNKLITKACKNCKTKPLKTPKSSSGVITQHQSQLLTMGTFTRFQIHTENHTHSTTASFMQVNIHSQKRKPTLKLLLLLLLLKPPNGFLEWGFPMVFLFNKLISKMQNSQLGVSFNYPLQPGQTHLDAQAFTEEIIIILSATLQDRGLLVDKWKPLGDIPEDISGYDGVYVQLSFSVGSYPSISLQWRYVKLPEYEFKHVHTILNSDLRMRSLDMFWWFFIESMFAIMKLAYMEEQGLPLPEDATCFRGYVDDFRANTPQSRLNLRKTLIQHLWANSVDNGQFPQCILLAIPKITFT